MARRRRRIPRKRTNRWLVAVQILMLLGILIFILLFRDLIATGASEMVGSFSTQDVHVQSQPAQGEPAQRQASEASATGADAGSTDSRDDL